MDSKDFTEQQFTMAPFCEGLPGSLKDGRVSRAYSRYRMDLHFDRLLLGHLPDLILVAQEHSSCVDGHHFLPVRQGNLADVLRWTNNSRKVSA